MDHQTFIIGHRNPDADSICSALAYEAYKHAKGETHCRAARCGNSNARIDAILKRFKQELPVFIGDLTPRVRDIMVTDVKKISHRQTCAEALEMIDQYDVRILPVLDDNQSVLGTLSVFQLGEYFIPKPKAQKQMRHVHTSIEDIVRALKADSLHLNEAEKLEDLYVRVGAMDIRTFGRFTEGDPNLAGQSIIVVGDRYDIQIKCINAGVRLLVITGNLEVDEEIVEMARLKNVSLIVSPFDSATTSWIIRSATRIERILEKDTISFSPEEKVSVVRHKINERYAPAYLVVDENNKLLGVFSKGDILKPSRTNLILVDHNELTQAVTGADKVNITEIIDHHRLGNPSSQQPILFFNEPVGSTCTIVGDMFRREQLRPSAEIAGVMMAGMISDTLNLHSPTSTAKDKDILQWLEEIAEIKADELADLIFSAGSVILNSEPQAVIRADMKTYNEGTISYSVSQVEELGFDNFWKHCDALQEALAAVRKKEGLFFSALLVTDINTQNSLLLVNGEEDVSDQINYPEIDHHDVFELNGIVSRKKQLIPYLTTLLRNIGVETGG